MKGGRHTQTIPKQVAVAQFVKLPYTMLDGDSGAVDDSQLIRRDRCGSGAIKNKAIVRYSKPSHADRQFDG